MMLYYKNLINNTNPHFYNLMLDKLNLFHLSSMSIIKLANSILNLTLIILNGSIGFEL